MYTAILHVSHIDSCGSLSFTVLRGCHVWSGHVLSQFAPDSCLTCNRQGTCVCKRHQLLPFILLTWVEQLIKSMSVASFEGVTLQVWDINYCPVYFWPELSSSSRACLLQVLVVSLCNTFIFADLTCPKACMVHTSFGCVPLPDIHICSLDYVYWQFFMSLTLILVVHYPLRFWEDVMYGVAMFYPSLLLTLV